MNAVNAPASTPQTACAVYAARKHYGGVTALAGVDLEVYPGIIHAIVGENGAGKSTLMKLLAGAEQPDAGQIIVSGQQVRFHNVKQANERGIAIVFQELSLFPDLDVLANLFMLREPRRLGVVQRSEMKQRAKPILEELGLSVDVDRPVGKLTLSEQQLVEIAKALLADSRVLILDEPNSALNARESERLFAVMRKLRARGVAILYISHRLEEVFAIADRITVMRNGRVVNTLNTSETTISQVVAMMIGRDLTEYFSETQHTMPTVAQVNGALRIENISVGDAVKNATLMVAPGEIVGLAGLEGSGVNAVLDAVFGLEKTTEGRIILPDGRHLPRDIPGVVRSGIAMVPADRRNEGLMLEQDILSNIAQVTAGVLGRFGFVMRHKRIEERANARSKALRIVAPSVRATVSNLSGGNQQKVVIAKWLEADPRVVLLNDPTRGVDIGAKEEIYQIIRSLVAEGRVVLFTSTELTEFVHLCDRVLIFYRGQICGEIPHAELTTQRLLEAINTGKV